MKTLLPFSLIILLFISACSHSGNEDTMSDLPQLEVAQKAISPSSGLAEETVASGNDKMSDVSDPRQVVNDEIIPEKIIKDGSLSMEIEDYKSTKTRIKSTVSKWEGYISSENETNDNYRISNDMVIRVPAEAFDSLISGLSELAQRIEYKRVNATDVGEEYFDIETRLKTKKKVENRYTEFLKEAKNIEEVLMVEDKLRVIREEIEAKEGRLRFLKNRIALSTLNLNIYQTLDYTYQPEQDPSFFQRILKAMHFGWKGLLAFIIGLVYLWPFLLILAIGFYILRWYLRRKRSRKKNKF